jgi:Mrp family chromosome partitioning ATPase
MQLHASERSFEVAAAYLQCKEVGHMGEECPGVSSSEAGKAEACRGCPNAGYCSDKRQMDPDIGTIRERLGAVKKIVAVMSGKGGVGKSTVTRNVAECLAQSGMRVCILDLDLCGPSIPRLTGTDGLSMCESNNMMHPVKVRENLAAVSAGYLEEGHGQAVALGSSSKTAMIKRILLQCDFSTTDVLLIDTPPGVSDEHLGIVNFIKPSSAVIVTTPQRFSLQDVVRQIDFCKKARIRVLGIVENMKRFICGECQHQKNIFSSCGVQEYCADAGLEYLGSMDLKLSIAKNSDSGLSVDEPIFARLREAILDG